MSKNTSTARFHSDTTTLFPHGLGVAYTNDNLTDKAARYILKNDPDAAQFFKVLPPDAEDGEDDAQPAAESAPATTSAATPAQAGPAGFDYARLASAMVDELERRDHLRNSQPDADDDTDEQPALTASTGGADENSSAVKTETLGNGVEVTTGQPAADHDDEQPVRLSRMNKEQLLTAYRVELRLEPAEGLTNDQLRDAIAEHRAGQQDSE